jgi:formylglycine-generating enzyme required for sulfatase activity
MAGTFDKAKFVVTSRPAALRDGIALDLAHQRVSVRDFSPEQQESFLNNWYKAAYLHEIRPKNRTKKEWKAQQEGEARKLAEAIIEYLRKPENRGIRELAAIPMLLQIMAILWKERRFLPGRRQELYSAALDYLLDYRDRERNLEPLLSAGDARRVLAPVALWMQETLGNDEADRSAVQQKMQEKLDAIKPPHTVGEICRNLVDRAGVLVEQGKASYVFRHKTFREYLAGEQLRDEWFEAGRLKLLVRHFGEKSGWWDEVILFLMGQSNTRLFDQFMKLLFASPVSRDFSPKQKSLLARVIEESPEKKGDALCQALLRKGEKSAYRQRALLETLKVLALPKSLDALLTFRKAGLALDDDIHVLAEDVILLIGKAAGGEPSLLIKKQDVSVPLVTHPELIRNPYEFDAQYLLIPGGKYIYSQPEPKGTVLTVPNLWFAKYPVTNRQFRAFIAFLGGKSVENTKALSVKAYTQALHDLAHTGEDTLNGFDEYLKKESDLVKRFTSGRDEDRRFNKDDQPVTGVTFFDARAYCLWLSMLSDAEYRLPTEEEWEWAAGGRREEAGRVQKVKEYPWGDKPEPTPKHANYGENEGATTPVGRYPDGATPEGLYDMAGNVWEWTGSRYSEDTSAVSLRGGSWYFKSELLRCRARFYYSPGIYYVDYFGFRVVCPSPILKI